MNDNDSAMQFLRGAMLALLSVSETYHFGNGAYVRAIPEWAHEAASAISCVQAHRAQNYSTMTVMLSLLVLVSFRSPTREELSNASIEAKLVALPPLGLAVL